ncbi:hypothetical protein BST91_02090 [Nonlabens tegetincola]|uniref:S41 family peptidase n=1 Tax=Nonlabens tegetincola TaxID=323273 RepID=UPI000A206244|nr:S41 family peptidase [Nonlabens tegetincola]ARN70532.1 hypothetical protein BST91_02090 [Nonlabens tegetincola]
MKPTFFTPLFIVLFFNVQLIQSQSEFCQRSKRVIDLIEQHHYNPQFNEKNWNLSAATILVNQLDEDHILLSSEQSELIQDHAQADFNSLINLDCINTKFYENLMLQSIIKKHDFLTRFLTTKPDYTSIEQVKRRKNLENYWIPKNELENVWTKQLKLSIFFSHSANFKELDIALDKFPEQESEHRINAVNESICQLEYLINNPVEIKRKIEASFLNAIGLSQDKHTRYFTINEKESFEKDVSLNQESFGISLRKDDNLANKLVVGELLSTGLNEKTELPEENDVVVSIKTEDVELDFNCLSNSEINQKINSEAQKSITLITQDKDGNQKETTINKRELPVISNFLRGYLLNDRSIGYLKINSFYTDLEKPDGLGMANDAAAEIYKLIQSNIKGLIIDLRFNGGGSLKEAVDFAGLFINRGPVSIINTTDQEEPIILKDFNRGAAYSGPLVILVNKYSASASELFTNVMKDYNRGVIVGSTTYGKSTMQVVLPVNEDEPKDGFMKLTTGAFYNIYGKSHNEKGITPDVALPDGTNTTAHATSFTQPFEVPDVQAASRIPVNAPLGLDNIISSSTKRAMNNDVFKKMNLQREKFDQLFHKSFDLTLESVFKHYQEITSLISEPEISYTDALFTVEDHESTTEILKYNSIDQEYNEEIKLQLSSDPYVQESIHILTNFNN